MIATIAEMHIATKAKLVGALVRVNGAPCKLTRDKALAGVDRAISAIKAVNIFI